MKKFLLIAAGIIIAASATLFAAEQMDSMANGAWRVTMIGPGAPTDIRMPGPR